MSNNPKKIRSCQQSRAFHQRRVHQKGSAWDSWLEIAPLLVITGADVNVTDDEACAPLHATVTAQSGYREIAELLLGRSASL